MESDTDMDTFMKELAGGMQNCRSSEQLSLTTVTDDSQSKDVILQVSSKLVETAFNDYMELSDKIAQGTTDPEMVSAAAAIISSLNQLLETMNKRDMLNQKLEHDRWKVKMQNEGKIAAIDRKHQLKEPDYGQNNTFIQNNTIQATREEVLKALVEGANNNVDVVDVEEVAEDA